MAQYASLTQEQKAVYGLMGLNTLVFLAWRPARLQPFMYRNFTQSPNRRVYTGLTSVFSHNETWHFAFNQMALYSFGGAVARALGVETFLAFYVSGGVCASLGSLSHAVLFKAPSMWRPSLGASGALYAMLGAVACWFPHANVMLLFLPMLSFPIGYAFPALCAIDAAGVLLRWKRFDHVAHLSGAAFGWMYARKTIEGNP
jgi:rhomboid-like protein